jgi:hypothetical protein
MTFAIQDLLCFHTNIRIDFSILQRMTLVFGSKSLLLVLLGIYSKVGLLDFMVILFKNFEGPLFSIATVPFYISTNSAQGFQFLYFFVNS